MAALPTLSVGGAAAHGSKLAGAVCRPRCLASTDVAADWQPQMQLPVMRAVEEKLEHVAAGHVVVHPLSTATFYIRPDVVRVSVSDTGSKAVRRSTETDFAARLAPRPAWLLFRRHGRRGTRSRPGWWWHADATASDHGLKRADTPADYVDCHCPCRVRPVERRRDEHSPTGGRGMEIERTVMHR